MTVPLPPRPIVPTTPQQPPAASVSVIPQITGRTPTVTAPTISGQTPTVTAPTITGRTPTVTASTISGRTPTVAATNTTGQTPTLAGVVPRMTDSIGGAGGSLQDYMNPYLDNVMRDGLDEMRRQYDLNRQQGAAGAHMAGAFGDARHGVWEGEAERNFNTQGNQFINQVLAQGYNNAQGLREGDINRMMSANQFDIGTGVQTRQADANRQLQAMLANAGFDMSALTQDQQAKMQAAMANAGYGMQGLTQDQQARMQAGLANAGYGMQGLTNDQQARMQAGLANAGYGMQGLESDASRTFAGQQFDVSNLMNMQNNDANRQMQLALAAPGMEGQNIDNQLSIINAIMGSGNQQQGQDQKSANLAYLDFLRQQGWGEEQLGVITDVLNSIPMGQTTNSTQTQQNASNPLGAIVSMMSLLPWSTMI